MKKHTVLIIGAGPAGLTAAYELLDKSKDYDIVVLEESNTFGGISRTVNYKGNRMDMGGIVSFLRSQRLMNGGKRCSQHKAPCRMMIRSSNVNLL